MKSPFSLLFGKEPDYLSLRVFGIRCFPCLREYATNKFEPKSLPYFFLGYSEKYEGYKCLYPLTGRIFISQHVVFHETLFPFKKPSDLFVPAVDEANFSTFTDWVQVAQNDTALSCGHEPCTRNQIMSPDSRSPDSQFVTPSPLAFQYAPILDPHDQEPESNPNPFTSRPSCNEQSESELEPSNFVPNTLTTYYLNH